MSTTFQIIFIILFSASVSGNILLYIFFICEKEHSEFWEDLYTKYYGNARHTFKGNQFDELTKGAYNPEMVPALLEKRMEMYDQIFGHKKGGIVSSKVEDVVDEKEKERILELFRGRVREDLQAEVDKLPSISFKGVKEVYEKAEGE